MREWQLSYWSYNYFLLADPANFVPPHFSFVNIFLISENLVVIIELVSVAHMQSKVANKKNIFPAIFYFLLKPSQK